MTGCNEHTCPTHSPCASIRLREERDGSGPTPMARFLGEATHEHGIAFVRPSDQEVLMMEVYMEDLDEYFDIGGEEPLDVVLEKEDEAGLKSKEEEIDQTEK